MSALPGASATPHIPPLAAGPDNGAQAKERLASFQEKPTAYAYWALLLLVLANFFNYVDRHVVAIVATGIQRDLGMTDAQLGFLMGTAFATLYSMVGIGMGRIADAISRTRLLACGLAIWSAMTALSGLAFNFASLALTRVGVGIGEAIANPCSHSLLSDYFPPRNRSIVLGIYLIGAPLGIAGSMILGGYFLGNWTQICPTLPGNACAISDWQATFLVVGIPGLLLAMLVALLYEPRPRSPDKPVAHIVARELSSALPPFTFINILAEGGRRQMLVNFAIAGGLLLLAALLALLTGDWAQWIAIALGTYSVATWAQVLRLRDRPLFRMTLGSRTSLYIMLGGAMTGTMSVTVSSWAAPYAMRILEAPPAQVGLYLGASSLASSVLAAVIGGYVTDRWKLRDPRAPLWMGLFSLLGPAIPLWLMMSTDSLVMFTVWFALFSFFALAWMGGFAALIQDSVLPRMRGTASAMFALVVTLIAAGLGPYMVGKISTVSGSLSMGMLSLLIVMPVGAVLLIAAARRFRAETPAVREAWAVDAGEIIEDTPPPRTV